MGIFDVFKKRATPATERQKICAVVNNKAFADLCAGDYVSLAECPEILAGIDQIAELVRSMTIYLKQNRYDENGAFIGDYRVRNGLSRLLDINPNPNMTRANFIRWIVKVMLLHGNAVVVPHTNNGYLESLQPIAPSRVGFDMRKDGRTYVVQIDRKDKNPASVLHFAINPNENKPYIGSGYKVSLEQVAKSLKQADTTKNSFLKSEWKPSLIIKIDGDFEGLNSPQGRGNILRDYVQTQNAGDPWLLPLGAMEVEQVKPLTLNDLAINSSVELDKKTVASILGVPAFVLGIGQYNKSEYNNFINTKIKYIAQIIEQERTKKLLYDDSLYFEFNRRSILAYDLNELRTVATRAVSMAIMDRNEARDWLGLSPRDGLSELVLLENYIPFDKLGDQEKLQGGGEV